MNLITNASANISKFVRISLRAQRAAEARARGAERRSSSAPCTSYERGCKGVRNAVRKYCRKGVRNKGVRKDVRNMFIGIQYILYIIYNIMYSLKYKLLICIYITYIYT